MDTQMLLFAVHVFIKQSTVALISPTNSRNNVQDMKSVDKTDDL